MARAEKCIMEGTEITVEKAIIIRDAVPSGRRKTLGFDCIGEMENTNIPY